MQIRPLAPGPTDALPLQRKPLDPVPRDGFAGSVQPPERLPRFATADGPPLDATQKVLQAMRGIMTEVHVVAGPGPKGEPPILSGPDLPALPSRRWTVTPRIEALHRQRMETTANEDLLREDDLELRPFVAPLLDARYGDRKDMTILELGPATSTVVPDTLAGRGHRYVAMDLSMPFLEKNRELLHDLGHTADGMAVQVRGDSYGLPFRDGTCDLVFTSCHPPFVSASPEDQVLALSEAARVLKEGGEFVLFPWHSEEKDPRVEGYLLRTFEVAERHTSPLGPGRDLLILRKR